LRRAISKERRNNVPKFGPNLIFKEMISKKNYMPKSKFSFVKYIGNLEGNTESTFRTLSKGQRKKTTAC
jgi:hypothetical protein